jgi:delta 1-pyrroline-5-carboxylate dehydrogenase
MSVQLTDTVQKSLHRLQNRMLIGDEWSGSSSGKIQSVLNPADGEIFCSVPEAGPQDVARAVQAARAAFENPSWASMRPADRERLILKLADLLELHAAEFAELETLDNGKPLMLSSRVDVPGAIEYLRYIAGWATKLEGSTVDVSFPRPRHGGEYFAYTPGAGRSGSRYHAVELPSYDGRMEAWASTGHWLHGNFQAGERDADDVAALG